MFRMTIHASRVLFLAMATLLAAATARGADDLKLSRVALFSSGVGYFQLDGSVNGTAATELRFRTEQINDIIKSLVLMDFDGGAISAVQYPTHDPIEKTLKSFGVDITGRPTFGQLLDQLRGVEIEYGDTSRKSGVIVGVEERPVPTEKAPVMKQYLTLNTAEGLISGPLEQFGTVRIKDEKLAGELRGALATLATAHDADKKVVTLNFAGKGSRRVRCGYLLETPIWKTSYRLVLSADKKPYLQGWATVENTTEADWNDVRLTLVSGRPISFTMDLYSPLYVPRPREELELYASLRPPTYEAAEKAKAELSWHRDMAMPRAAAAPGMQTRDQYGGATGGGGGGSGRDVRLSGSRSEDDISLNGSGVSSVANAEQAGELFAYNIETPVTLRRQQSAMLPIVAGELEGEKLSIYNPATHVKYPLNGVQISNGTALHLMQGPVTIFDGNQYAGDAKLPDLRPGEKRLLAYALDLAVEVNQKMQAVPAEVISVKIGRGYLLARRKIVDSREYHLRNKDDKPKTVLIEQPTGSEWKLIEPGEPFEKAANLNRYKVVVPARSEATLKVVMERQEESSLTLTTGGWDTVEALVRERVTSEAVRKAVVEVAKRRAALDTLRTRRDALDHELTGVNEDQSRIRENFKALPRESDLAKRYLKKLDEQETRIESLRGQVAELTKRIDAAKAELEQYIESLNIE
ncbi:MAG: hypothetical protein U1A27_11655 [Phycisphaerae bacterium]